MKWLHAPYLHHGAAFTAAHLQHHTQFFVEQGVEHLDVAATTDLFFPVFGFATVHAAVRRTLRLHQQHVDIQRHSHLAGKGHFGHTGQQAAVAAVVVGQNLPLLAQCIHGMHQTHQVLGIIQIRHGIAALPQHLTQDTAGHAVFAPAQIHQ